MLMGKKFCLVTNAHGSSYEELAKIVYPKRQEYAATHNYGCGRPHHPGLWSKFHALLDCWYTAEWLWWLDIDATITNNNIKLDSFIEPDKEMVINCDLFGINAGSFLVKTTDRMRSIIEWACENKVQYRNHWPDQTALAHLLWKVIDLVKVVPQRSINSYPDYKRDRPEEIWQPGDFVLHCPGMPMDRRIRLLKESHEKMQSNSLRTDEYDDIRSVSGT